MAVGPVGRSARCGSWNSVLRVVVECIGRCEMHPGAVGRSKDVGLMAAYQAIPCKYMEVHVLDRDILSRE